MELVDAPWDASALDAGEMEFRRTTFGRFGLLSFHVHERNELLVIFDVTWAG